MNIYEPVRMPELAGSSTANRPAAIVVENPPEARLVLFRIGPGQEVATHTSASAVFISVLSGGGFVSGAEGESPVRAGMVAAITAGEPHGMRAGEEELVLAALIAPRPGG